VIGNISEKPAASIFMVETYQAITWMSYRKVGMRGSQNAGLVIQSEGPQTEYNSLARNEGKWENMNFRNYRLNQC
jgi:hypothetical protein